MISLLKRDSTKLKGEIKIRKMLVEEGAQVALLIMVIPIVDAPLSHQLEIVIVSQILENIMACWLE
jgi:hypothetical protein